MHHPTSHIFLLWITQLLWVEIKPSLALSIEKRIKDKQLTIQTGFNDSHREKIYFTQFSTGQEILDVRSCCAPIMHLN